MNKLIRNWLTIVALGAIIVVVAIIWRNTAPTGISFQEPSFGASNISYKSVACGSNGSNGTGTAIFGAQPGRMSFSASNPNLMAVYICRSADTCRVGSSTIAISATTSISLPVAYNQEDAYIGGYSCVSDGATTTISAQEAK